MKLAIILTQQKMELDWSIINIFLPLYLIAGLDIVGFNFSHIVVLFLLGFMALIFALLFLKTTLTKEQCLQYNIIKEASKGLFTIFYYHRHDRDVTIAIRHRDGLKYTDKGIRLVNTQSEKMVYQTDKIVLSYPIFTNSVDQTKICFMSNDYSVVKIHLIDTKEEYTKKEIIKQIRDAFVFLFNNGVKSTISDVQRLDWSVNKELGFEFMDNLPK